MKKNLTLILIIILGMLLSFSNYLMPLEFDSLKSLDDSGFKQYSYEEKLCLDFIGGKMRSKSKGIYTNFLDSKELKDYATGHEILSESEGLIMLYYVKNNNKKQFDIHLKFIKEKMMLENGLMKWRVRENNPTLTTSTASIDDLRIVRGLIHGYDKWGDKEYIKQTKKISKSLLRYNVKNNFLNDYYDSRYNSRSQRSTLSYIDLFTIRLLSRLDSKWNKVYEQGLKTIEKGYISDEFPHYNKTYNILKKNIEKSNTINSIDSLLVVMHLSEIGKAKKESIRWIREQIYNNNAIFSKYSCENGKPLSNMESTAIYAITARIAKNINDKVLYEKAMKRMLSLQIKSDKSIIQGAFGDINSQEVYSFDNLQALLAF